MKTLLGILSIASSAAVLCCQLPCC